jgi:uncharacterized protein
MAEELNLVLPPEVAFDEAALKDFISRYIKEKEFSFRILKRSVDARKPAIKINVTVQVLNPGEEAEPITPFVNKDVSSGREVIIAGCGPAGLFAALTLIEAGLKPVIIERGAEVAERKRDVAAISTKHIVNPDSNYCFGEGGAGTFSDGKLYTRSKKRGDNRRVLELLVLHGADPAILYEAHPHLGTDRLPRIITSLRETILKCGGVILFKSRLNDIIIEKNCFRGVILDDSRVIKADNLVLATGHSSRDVYKILSSHNVKLVYKPFAMGVRVEHPQDLIDRIQYHGKQRGKYLPPATYTLVTQVEGRGVYSFCMCPGGFMVPSATGPEEVVVNGMSPSGRNSPYANSGIVVELREEDLPSEFGSNALSGMFFQQSLEKLAWEQGGKSQCAPAQRLSDFVAGRSSSSLPKASYFPGIVPSALHEWLPEMISSRLRQGFNTFGRSLRGFITDEAVVVAVESRTSSPVRIVRDRETMTAEGIEGLYPAGEGAGYAGGIVSSAVDGTLAAMKIAEKYV